VIILPQSSSDKNGQSITFEWGGNDQASQNIINADGSLTINLNLLRSALLNKHHMQTPRYCYSGHPLVMTVGSLVCQAGDTLVCYDTFDDEQDDKLGKKKRAHVPEVVDLLSDSEDEQETEMEKDKDKDSSTAKVVEVIDVDAEMVQDSGLAMLISMGFQTDIARQALRASAGERGSKQS
jgi:hypothetical protein